MLQMDRAPLGAWSLTLYYETDRPGGLERGSSLALGLGRPTPPPPPSPPCAPPPLPPTPSSAPGRPALPPLTSGPLILDSVPLLLHLPLLAIVTATLPLWGGRWGDGREGRGFGGDGGREGFDAPRPPAKRGPGPIAGKRKAMKRPWRPFPSCPPWRPSRKSGCHKEGCLKRTSRSRREA